MSLRERLAPVVYDAYGKRAERELAARRRMVLAVARGRVLEIGVGTGLNLPHYPDGLDELVITDPSGPMLERARRRAAEAGRDATLVHASAEALPFPDASFDAVVSTLVLCSVPAQDEALRELRRVLKPRGELLFIEHVRSEDPARAKWQDRLERPWKLVAGGCHPNRDTLAAIERGGFTVVGVEQTRLPKAPPIVRPCVAGRAAVPA